jgi:predicted amidohydrolase YtcJ
MIKTLLTAITATTSLFSAALMAAPELIVVNANITDFHGNHYSAVSVENGVFSHFSNNADALLAETDDSTTIIDAKGKRLIPGINDSHLHVTRGGRFYNLETRWEGITTLEQGLQMIKEQAERTPEGQWVRVVGGFSPYQFKEKRLPTPQELTAIAPNTPVFVLHLYSGAVLNQKALEVLGITRETQAPEGSVIERGANGVPTGVLLAQPNPMILYKTIAALPQMDAEEQLNSSRQFYRKLLSLGVTSVVDAGGGGHSFPDDYTASETLAKKGELPLRVSNYLFPQVPANEMLHFMQWMHKFEANENHHTHLDNGYVIEGGGELLTYKASDYENFRAPRPELPSEAEHALEEVIRLHLLEKWPFRLHATYDESITRILNVLEKVNKTQRVDSVRWIIDHAETISKSNIKRVKALGGAIAVQGRMAFAGEDFVSRYGKTQASRTPPIHAMLDAGITVGLGTDGTRVSSFNPWATYYWAVTGKTIGQFDIGSKPISRIQALKLFTQGSAALSGEENVKGQLAPGFYADFAILNHDILNVNEEALLNTQSQLTVVGGKVVFADKDEFTRLHKAPIKAIPSWSPVNFTEQR